MCRYLPSLSLAPWLAALLLAGCAAPDPSAPPETMRLGARADELPPIPICRDEMVALVEVSRLARLHGQGWVDFEPAIVALKQRLLDCIAVDGDRFRAL